MKKILLILIIILSLTETTIASIEPMEYTPLETGILDNVDETDFSDFLTGIFNLGIALAVVLTVIMMVWGGVEYMTTDSWHGKDDGKKKIKDALKGILLALAAYLILWTINPDLVNFKNNTLLQEEEQGQ